MATFAYGRISTPLQDTENQRPCANVCGLKGDDSRGQGRSDTSRRPPARSMESLTVDMCSAKGLTGLNEESLTPRNQTAVQRPSLGLFDTLIRLT